MLVLSRKLSESIVIPGLNVTIRIVGIKGGRVMLGIDAPLDVTVHRSEVAAGIADQGFQEQAAPRRAAI